MKTAATKTEDKKESRLSIPGKLPFEDYASSANLADVLKMLVNKGVLSVEDYELLVMRGYMFPKLKAMTDDNGMEIRAQLLEFLEEGRADRLSSDHGNSDHSQGKSP
jgi:hypothetical protein